METQTMSKPLSEAQFKLLLQYAIENTHGLEIASWQISEDYFLVKTKPSIISLSYGTNWDLPSDGDHMVCFFFRSGEGLLAASDEESYYYTKKQTEAIHAPSIVRDAVAVLEERVSGLAKSRQEEIRRVREGV